MIFLPFHYGYWDTDAGYEPDSPEAGLAANDLTLTDCDPASKQPIFKTAAARLERLEGGTGPAPAPTTTASAPVGEIGVRTEGGPTARVDEDVRATWRRSDEDRTGAADLLGRHADAGLLLLRDLRHILTQASGVSADWEMLAQAAQGIKHHDLLALAQRCHPDTLRQSRWANAMIKEVLHADLIS